MVISDTPRGGILGVPKLPHYPNYADEKGTVGIVLCNREIAQSNLQFLMYCRA